MKTLELTSDVVFKSFMLSDNTKNYKARLISLITSIDEEVLRKAKYTSQELKINNKQDKIFKTDIIAEIKNHMLNIEMNKEYYDGLFQKNTSYYSRIRSEELDSGEDYIDLKKIIQINLDDFHKYNGNKLVYEFKMREKDTENIEDNLLTSYHIDLKILKDKCYNNIDTNVFRGDMLMEKEKQEELEKLLRIFVEDDLDKLRGDPIMDEAIDELERISQDKKIIGLYNAEAVERKVYNSKMKYAEKIGMEKGMEKGMKKGMEKGIEQGIQKEKIEITKKLLSKNINIDVISEITELKKEEIEGLK